MMLLLNVKSLIAFYYGLRANESKISLAHTHFRLHYGCKFLAELLNYSGNSAIVTKEETVVGSRGKKRANARKIRNCTVYNVPTYTVHRAHRVKRQRVQTFKPICPGI